MGDISRMKEEEPKEYSKHFWLLIYWLMTAVSAFIFLLAIAFDQYVLAIFMAVLVLSWVYLMRIWLTSG